MRLLRTTLQQKDLVRYGRSPILSIPLIPVKITGKVVPLVPSTNLPNRFMRIDCYTTHLTIDSVDNHTLGSSSLEVFVRRVPFLFLSTVFGLIAQVIVPPVPGPPTTLQVVSGSNQSAVVNTEYAQPMTVRVLDANGIAVP